MTHDPQLLQGAFFMALGAVFLVAGYLEGRLAPSDPEELREDVLEPTDAETEAEA